MIAYLDCVGGLAGDMLIAALIDAGAPVEALHSIPDLLGLDGVGVSLERVQRHGIGALALNVHGDHDRHHPERTWRSIRGQLQDAALAEPVRQRALAVFGRLAEVEGAIHGVSAEEIHFHELGAVDTLIDVVGAVTLLEELEVRQLVCSPLPMPRGMVRAAHGVLPLPAPATAELLTGALVYGVDIEAELVTPTGAVLAAVLADGWGPMPAMRIRSIGYGAGTMDLDARANVVRVVLGSAEESFQPQHDVVLLETNLDDLIPELVPDAVERCFSAGALDVWTAPVAMKKGRPGVVLSALVRPEREAPVARAMLEHTTAIGVRVARLRRYELDREEHRVEVYGQAVRVKLARLDGQVVNVAPEHDDCAAVARDSGSTVKSVWSAALAAARPLYDSPRAT